MSEGKNTPKELMDRVASIILAGGQGTRLHPLTLSRCKPSVCFGGGYRLIDIPISNSLNTHIHRIFVISQYFASSLQQHILETYPLNYFRESKIEMLSPEETPQRTHWFLGTADAVRQNLEHFEAAPVDYFLILSGDQLYNINFTEMLQVAKTRNTDLIIASIPIEEKEATRMGLLKINPDDTIKDFYEKPSHPELLKDYALSQEFFKGHGLETPSSTHYLASMGIYIFKRQALFDLIKHEGNDFGKDLIPLQVKKGKTAAYIYKGYWEDIGTIASYYQANLALTTQENCLNMYDMQNPIFTHPQNLPSPLIDDTLVHQSIIGQGAVIKAKEITSSIIGMRIKIDKRTIVRGSIILGVLFNTPQNSLEPYDIGQDCLLEKVIVDERARIGNHVTLTNKASLQNYDGNGIYIRDGIIIVASGTHVPDGFIL